MRAAMKLLTLLGGGAGPSISRMSGTRSWGSSRWWIRATMTAGMTTKTPSG